MMNIVLCHWFWLSIIPSLWWGVVVLIVLIMALRIAKSIIESHINSKQQIIKEQHRYEKEMKDDAFEREKEWYFIKRTEKPLKIEEDLKKCQDKLEEFQKKEKEINEGTASLKKDKEQFEKKVLETKIKVYEEILKTINK
jgi:septal ring factor EnvC (AmiA/AmiB activator)